MALRAVREEAESAVKLKFRPDVTNFPARLNVAARAKCEVYCAINNELTSLKTVNTLKPVLMRLARQHTPRIIQTRWHSS